jgi:hypothetical protein
VLTVTSAGDYGLGTLRATVGAARPGDVVEFSPRLDGQTITLTIGEIPLPDGVAIEGPGPDQLSIDGNSNSRIFEIVPPQNAGDGYKLTAISGLTLDNGSADAGAAIQANNDALAVSNCVFAGNAATREGGAIASNGALVVDECIFFDNDVATPLLGSNNLGLPNSAVGGAIWCGSDYMELTSNKFFFNHVAGIAESDYAFYSRGQGGAVAWQGGDDAYDGASILILGNTFVYNSAVGGSSSYAAGGDADGGAIFVATPATSGAYNAPSIILQVSNNTFNGNTARAGGFDSNAWGGSLQIGDPYEGLATIDPQFSVTGNQFSNGGAYGGVNQEDGQGGFAYGGAVGFVAGGMVSPTFTFDQNTVSGAIAQGGAGVGEGFGGGVSLVAGPSSNASFFVEADTVSGDEAIGGDGGQTAQYGYPGGFAGGGGIAALTDGIILDEATAPIFVISQSIITNCTAIGGSGGAALQGSQSNGGSGGDGAEGSGGGVFLLPNVYESATFIVSHDLLVHDSAIGGPGGAGANGEQRLNGGNGGSGGDALGGGLSIVNSLAESAYTITVSNCLLVADKAVAGKGGSGGFGIVGGSAGVGGDGQGGAAGVNGVSRDTNFDVTFNADALVDCTAQGGDGGTGGGSIAGGYQGGAGGTGSGGGIAVSFFGDVLFENCTITGNQAVGGKGGQGGNEHDSDGPNGQNGVGMGGGVCVYAPPRPGYYVEITPDTTVTGNSAEIGPNIYFDNI